MPDWSDQAQLRNDRAAPRCRTIATSHGPVEFAEAGAGPPILYFHGTGAANDLVFLVERPLVRDGFRLIVPNRPGYGQTPLTGNESAVDCADLAAEILTSLGIERAAIMGSSGGGAFAAAFAARHPARAACLVLECAQIHRWDDRRWLAAASQWTFPLLKRPITRRWLLRIYRWQFRFQTPTGFLKFESGPRFDEVRHDAEALDLCRLTLKSMRRCLPHSAGFDNDFAVFLEEDGLQPGAVACPTLVIHDPLDPVAPVAHAEWVAQCVPQAQRCDIQAAGHLVWAGRDALAMHDRRVKFLRCMPEW